MRSCHFSYSQQRIISIALWVFLYYSHSLVFVNCFGDRRGCSLDLSGQETTKFIGILPFGKVK